jgi:molybdopterin-containing oxidoreductase family membrane subunit
MPSAWGMYAGTVWDWSTYIGTIGLFLSLIYLFVRLLPMISIFEIRSVLPEPKPRSPKGGA